MSRFVFHELTAAAERYPSKAALSCEGQTLTYAEYETLTRRIASFLASTGFRRGDRAGISLEKSNEYICLEFGIMRAAGCYVPIDYAYPPIRKNQILTDCAIHTLFTSKGAYESLAADQDLPSTLKHVVLLDGRPDEVAPLKGVALHAFDEVRSSSESQTAIFAPNDNDLAYIMYTSGSTGKPKGVMINHRNILTFMEWCNDKLALGPDDRIIQVAPFTFDISGLDTYNAVTQGASLYVIKNQLMINKILACIHKERITFISTVPTVIGTMIANPQVFKRYDLTCLKTIVSGAAACPAVFMKKLHEYLPSARLMNIYGPTEATIYCSYHWIDPAELDIDKPVPIGIPYENTEMYVVGPDGRELPAGEVGELILRGSHVSRGYYNDEAKTAAAFRSFPLMPHLNEKVYFTGDVSKKDELGRFYCLGRKDDMIKSRGYRIELPEIEIALSALDVSLESFAAVAVPDPLIENRIYATVVLRPGASLTEDDVKAHCRKKIPEYMVPDAVLFLPELPKTTSGKISRKDLVKMIQEKEL